MESLATPKSVLRHFRNEQAVEARAGEFDPDNQLAIVAAGLDVDDAALRGKLLVFLSGGGSHWNLDFQLNAEVERVTSGEGGAATILAASTVIQALVFQ